MDYEKAQVHQPKYGKSQTIYLKRCEDMCNVLADRSSKLLRSKSFIDLKLGVGLEGDLYWTFAVCFIYKFIKEKSHRPFFV